MKNPTTKPNTNTIVLHEAETPLEQSTMGAEEIEEVVQIIVNALSEMQGEPEECFEDLARLRQIERAKRVLH